VTCFSSRPPFERQWLIGASAPDGRRISTSNIVPQRVVRSRTKAGFPSSLGTTREFAAMGQRLDGLGGGGRHEAARALPCPDAVPAIQPRVGCASRMPPLPRRGHFQADGHWPASQRLLTGTAKVCVSESTVDGSRHSGGDTVGARHARGVTAATAAAGAVCKHASRGRSPAAAHCRYPISPSPPARMCPRQPPSHLAWRSLAQ